jgi:hypothetical protein
MHESCVMGPPCIVVFAAMRPVTSINLIHILNAPVCRERRGYGTKSRSTRLLPVRSRG